MTFDRALRSASPNTILGVVLTAYLMILLDLFPSGILQLWDSMTHGYWHARRLSFIMTDMFHLLEWVRIIGDMVFLIFGVFPTVYAILYTYLHERRKKQGKKPIATV